MHCLHWHYHCLHCNHWQYCCLHCLHFHHCLHCRHSNIFSSLAFVVNIISWFSYNIIAFIAIIGNIIPFLTIIGIDIFFIGLHWQCHCLHCLHNCQPKHKLPAILKILCEERQSRLHGRQPLVVNVDQCVK